MRKSKLLKAITLSCFIILISGFVAYRGGAFNQSISNDPMAENLNGTGNSVDSPPAKKAIMSSSKSFRVVDPEEKRKQAKNDSINKRDEMMSSSKSGGVFYEHDVKQQSQTVTPTSNPTVTAIPATTFHPNSSMMSSSKSGGMFYPKDIKTYTVTSKSDSVNKTQKKSPNNKNNQPNQSNQPNQRTK